MLDALFGFLTNATIPLLVIVLAAVISYGIITKLLAHNPLPIKIIGKHSSSWADTRSPRRRPPRRRAIFPEDNPNLWPEPDIQLLGRSGGVHSPLGNNIAIDFESSTVKAETATVPRYCKQEQIWNEEENRFVDHFVGQSSITRPHDDQLLYWFKVYTRRRTTRIDEKPTLWIQVMAKNLTNFLRYFPILCET
ncbi:hypothetical protein M422DRAFT_783617 [Sphaerobolus stellatus SS14]|uniref:Uncharacterized protein n=1 Tax=Sphaerobolus stellatus (strain SS14) TaxID=990650 RepID=A0A0C9V3J0_SPHS4|nr:hypothetical protein M422DRAFT_783617 [Sphaerobolus stellatus SS14]